MTTAIVTGAGRGIGEAIARRLARDGARVACVSRTESNASKTAAAINAATPDAARPYAVDVADRKAVGTLCEQILADFGRVDILVNNAGLTRDGLAMRMSEEDWDLVLDTNLKGAFNFIQGVMRPMVKQRSGRIVNIASVAAFRYDGNGAALYSITKSAVVRMTEALSVEWARYNINVNTIAPGAFSTEMLDGMIARMGDIASRYPRQRIGDPAQLDSTLLFLVSPSSECVTGTCITVDDGQSSK